MSKEYTVTRAQLWGLYRSMVKQQMFVNTDERLGAEFLLDYLQDQFNEVDAMRSLPDNAYIHL